MVDGRVAFDGVSDAEVAWNGVAKAHALSAEPLSCLPVLQEMEAGMTIILSILSAACPETLEYIESSR